MLGMRGAGTSQGRGGERPRAGRLLAISALAAAAVLALAAPAGAQTLLDEQVSAAEAVDQTCFTRDLSGEAGVASRTIEAPALGEIEARLEGTSGDWDLALINAREGGTITASAYRGASEVAKGYAFTGERIVVQACRRSGDAETADLTVEFTAVDASGPAPRISLARVITPTQEDRDRLLDLGLDLTEHGGENFVGAVLYGAQDRRTLEAAGFDYRVDIADLVEADAQTARQDARYTAAGGGRTLPSGSTTYRRLFHYSEDMKQLAERNPHLVKPITLPFRTYEGRKVEGIEITQNPNLRDGKPVFLQMGVHHAREWPSGEHAIEWAYELVRGYKNGNDRIQRLVNRTRTIVVPIVNPDGFNISRETGELQGAGDGRDADSDAEMIAQLVAFGKEYWRKNCRFPKGPPEGNCTVQTGNGLAHPGVDPNRNYGGNWGGPGASTNPTAQDYRGPGPFSEPETRNIRALISDRQVVTLVTNHTFSNLVLRPPGIGGEPDTVDEPLYRRLGGEMTSENGYSNLKSYQLYDTSGTTEDWSYYATGGLGFTYEIGCQNKLGTE